MTEAKSTLHIKITANNSMNNTLKTLPLYTAKNAISFLVRYYVHYTISIIIAS